MDNGSTDCVRVQSVFMDPMANYNDAFDPQSGQPLLRTTTITRRNANILAPDYRTKYVCQMRHVNIPMIHTVGDLRGDHVMKHPTPEKALLLHFRAYGSPTQKLINETRATTRSYELRRRVSEVWQAIFGWPANTTGICVLWNFRNFCFDYSWICYARKVVIGGMNSASKFLRAMNIESEIF
jgi:hypothetical protein